MRRKQPNPWLSIPAIDYEGHMGDPKVLQLQFLSRIFGELIDEFEPESLVVLGCATGNGFERIRPERIRRLIGVDINREYLDVCRKRHAARIPVMELVCGDAASFEPEPASIDFIHAALILEYVDPETIIEKASQWLKSRGILAVVLQLPAREGGNVSETGFESLKRLEPVIRLVDPLLLSGLCRRHGFKEERSGSSKLDSGKEFYIGVYRLEAPRAEADSVQ
ncbi:MAG: class I SAM-dependent methyltransferase [Candidatus Krumholzibacteria bacterium]|nr:class I SAM-dependent methyltransferase [Candidatus Krumholzibacteria bacterium]